jgi:hypothetical protein
MADGLGAATVSIVRLNCGIEQLKNKASAGRAVKPKAHESAGCLVGVMRLPISPMH